jgi:hypothetical protein
MAYEDYAHVAIPIFDYAKPGVKARYRVKYLCWKKDCAGPEIKVWESIEADRIQVELSDINFDDLSILRIGPIISIEKID